MVGGRRKLRERGGKTASRESRNGSVRSESRCFAQGLTRPMKRSLCLGRKWVLLGLLGPITFAVMRRIAHLSSDRTKLHHLSVFEIRAFNCNNWIQI